MTTKEAIAILRNNVIPSWDACETVIAALLASQKREREVFKAYCLKPSKCASQGHRCKCVAAAKKGSES
jgi:hypothetical protein